MMEDKLIIELYWERNQEAISQTAEKYGNYCTAIARNILQNEEDAEECVNDTWLGARNSIPPKRPEHLPGFLGKLTRYKAIDRLRAQHREKRGSGNVELALDEIAEIVPAGFSLEQNILDQELVQAINRFLTELPKEARMIFMLRYWFFADITEIAVRFGFSYSMERIIEVNDPVYTFHEVMDHTDLYKYLADEERRTGRPKYECMHSETLTVNGIDYVRKNRADAKALWECGFTV